MIHLVQSGDDSIDDSTVLDRWSLGLSQDMMYLGTGHPEHGADMNIRGGQAGFMRSLADGQFLAWPDYVGKLGVTHGPLKRR